MNDLPPTTLDELRRRNEAARRISARAVTTDPAAYRELRRMAAAVVAAPLDIGAYHTTTAAMVRLLERLCRTGAGTYFTYYRRAVDPRGEGDVRTFRALCRDMLATFAEFDHWRRTQGGLRRVK